MRDFVLIRPIETYKKSETKPSTLASRYWMTRAMELAKRINFPPTTASRLYAYTASIYADVLTTTHDEHQAGLATSKLLEHLISGEDNTIEAFRKDRFGDTSVQLSQSASNMLNTYISRSDNDHFVRSDLLVPPADKTIFWYRRDDDGDFGSTAGTWEPWIINRFDILSIVPPPPKRHSFDEMFDQAKIQVATMKRMREDIDKITFWHGATGVTKRLSGDNITPAGVWLNVLYEEEGAHLNDVQFAQAQKLLAQGIADSFIYTWQIKYRYWTQRPSMQIPALDMAVLDPPFPGYISGHSTISYTAATIMSSLFGDKKSLWERIARDAKNSRLLAGIHYSIDNDVGAFAGQEIGNVILNKQQGRVYHPDTYHATNRIIQITEYLIYQSILLTKQVFIWTKQLWEDIALIRFPVRFLDTSRAMKLPRNGGFIGVSFVDYDGDGYDDIYFANRDGQGNGLYHNEKGKQFTDVTNQAGVSFSGSSSVGVWGDWDNDGCIDLYLVNGNYATGIKNDEKMNDVLYHNNCDGTFTDVSRQAGIKDSFHGSGAAWTDFDNDGFLDIYVANYGYSVGQDWYSEPNMLYHNNGNGTFTDVAKALGVADVSIMLRGFNVKNGKANAIRTGFSHQPVWFDFNNDGLMDLFVATDRGISPLYKNVGNGTFKDITTLSGLSVGGTNMGVAVGDYDNDGFLDLYTTNVEANYLWHNNKNETFTEAAIGADAGDAGAIGWGTAFIDADNDGFLDISVANGVIGYPSRNPILGHVQSADAFFYNNRNGSFSERTQVAGLVNLAKSRGLALSDYDNDGRVDLVVVNTGGDSIIFKNISKPYHSMTFTLMGTKSNRSAIGSRITLTCGEKSYVREVAAGGSISSQNSLKQTFGLGSFVGTCKAVIHWPSGINSSHAIDTTNSFTTLREPAN